MSDDWCRAAVSAGRGEAAARDVPPRPTAFYSGEAWPPAENQSKPLTLLVTKIDAVSLTLGTGEHTAGTIAEQIQ